MLATDHATVKERPRPKGKEHPTALRMAELFIRNARQGYETTQEDLDADEFSRSDIVLYYSAARRIARETLETRDVTADAVMYDAQERIEKAANIVAGLVSNGEGVIFATLRQSGFATKELAKLYPAIIDRTCQIVVEQRTAKVQ